VCDDKSLFLCIIKSESENITYETFFLKREIIKVHKSIIIFLAVEIMAQQQETQGNELSFELLKNTQQIAEQAAIRAKEIALRSQKVPDIPSRGGSEQQRAPEIPPKRLSLKKTVIDDNYSNGNSAELIPIPQRNQERKPPPPVPQKPSSAQNSPRLKDKLTHPAVTAAMNSVSTTLSSSPQQQMFHERVAQNSPQLSAKNQNIVNILNSPLFQQRANQYKMQQQQQVQQQMMMTRQMKPTDDDFGSEDALRGIERGLKNMERAMKEQMTMRNMDFVDGGGGGKGNEIQFNPMEFKRSLGGSFNSLDGGGNGPTAINTMRMMGAGNIRLNFDGQAWGQRAIERNFSMDQMSIALQNAGMKGIPMDFNAQQQQQAPKHNIYRSLDRTLPLELQFSRHRQQQELEFMRQNNQILNLRQQQQQQQQQQQGMSREDLNLRRRSSHDETQYIMHQQQQKQATASGNAVANADNSGGMLMTLS
jgi:hypothetical protein